MRFSILLSSYFFTRRLLPGFARHATIPRKSREARNTVGHKMSDMSFSYSKDMTLIICHEDH